ncbi:hypothetical protein [Mesorhizobium sp. M0011]|uniref:hypothetical protein n=1 Tax=unclassified Mesorhizobium TaxID=325217 RepID=UPI00333C583B
MKKVMVLTTATILVAAAIFVYCSPLLVKLEKDGFVGGTLEIAGTKLDEAAGSGTTYHLVFVNEESSASVSCSKDGKVTSRDGYLSPWLGWSVSFHLSNCSISGFRPIF